MIIHCSNCGMNNKYSGKCLNDYFGNTERIAIKCPYFIPIDIGEENKDKYTSGKE